MIAKLIIVERDEDTEYFVLGDSETLQELAEACSAAAHGGEPPAVLAQDATGGALLRWRIEALPSEG